MRLRSLNGTESGPKSPLNTVESARNKNLADLWLPYRRSLEEKHSVEGLPRRRTGWSVLLHSSGSASSSSVWWNESCSRDNNNISVQALCMHTNEQSTMQHSKTYLQNARNGILPSLNRLARCAAVMHQIHSNHAFTTPCASTSS